MKKYTLEKYIENFIKLLPHGLVWNIEKGTYVYDFIKIISTMFLEIRNYMDNLIDIFFQKDLKGEKIWNELLSEASETPLSLEITARFWSLRGGLTREFLYKQFAIWTGVPQTNTVKITENTTCENFRCGNKIYENMENAFWIFEYDGNITNIENVIILIKYIKILNTHIEIEGLVNKKMTKTFI